MLRSLSCKCCKIPRMVFYCVPRSVPELRLRLPCVRSLLRRAGMMSVLLQRPTTAMAYALSRIRWSSAVWLLQGLMPRAVKGLILRPRATLFGSAGRKGSVVQASPTLPSSVAGPSKPGRDASGAEMPRYANVHADTLCVQHGTSFKSAQGSRRCAAGCSNSTGLGPLFGLQCRANKLASSKSGS